MWSAMHYHRHDTAERNRCVYGVYTVLRIDDALLLILSLITTTHLQSETCHGWR